MLYVSYHIIIYNATIHHTISRSKTEFIPIQYEFEEREKEIDGKKKVMTISDDTVD